MLVINAYINGHPTLSSEGNAVIGEFCKAIDIGPPVNVYKYERLAEILEENRDQKVLLFSNFPPNSSYSGSGKGKRTINEQGEEYESWDADSYLKSKSIFDSWIGKYNFKTIHFITGAPEKKLSDEMLKSLSVTIPITVTRKREWIHPAIEFEKLYIGFMKIKIAEAALKDPFA